MVEFSEEIIKKVVTLGSLGYPKEKCLNILELTTEQRMAFEQQFKQPKSTIGKAYQTGVDLADFEIDKKLYELAKTGDLKAIKEFELRKNARKNPK